MGIIKKLIENSSGCCGGGQEVFPITRTEAVYDSSGKRLDAILREYAKCIQEVKNCLKHNVSASISTSTGSTSYCIGSNEGECPATYDNTGNSNSDCKCLTTEDIAKLKSQLKEDVLSVLTTFSIPPIKEELKNTLKIFILQELNKNKGTDTSGTNSQGSDSNENPPSTGYVPEYEFEDVEEA